MVRLVPQENENQKIETSVAFQIQLGNRFWFKCINSFDDIKIMLFQFMIVRIRKMFQPHFHSNVTFYVPNGKGYNF